MRPMLGLFSRYRPRALTLVVLMAIAALIVLANSIEVQGPRSNPPTTYPPASSELQFDVGQPTPEFSYWGNLSYGWPLRWRQYVLCFAFPVTTVVGENCSVGRLTANVAIWLALLAVPAGVCEWLLRRYRPRWRFRLRTLLAVTGLAAAFCGWFAAARHRANVQDPLIADRDSRFGRVWGERWGPKWLDQFGADRYFRRIVGVEIGAATANEEDARVFRRLLKDLGRLPDLQYLSLKADRLTPETIAALGELRSLETLQIDMGDPPPGAGQALAEALGRLRRLRVLSVSAYTDEAATHECLAALGSLGQIEHLRLDYWTIASEDLALLAGLTKLKSLTLEAVDLFPDLADSAATLLAHLPPLERLEALDLESSEVVDRDVRFIARLPRLKSLHLPLTHVNDPALADLTLLQSLEELAMDGFTMTPDSLKALAGLRRLKKLHVDDVDEESWQSREALREALPADFPDSEIDACLKAYSAFRNANPRLVIDDDTKAIGTFAGQSAPKGKPIRSIPRSETFHRAVQVWKEKQAGKAAGPGAVNPPGAN